MTPTRVEVRAAQDGSLAIEGYAATFNRLSENLGGFREQILPGAFKRAIDGKQDVMCRMNHDSNCLLGRTGSGTCTVREDEHGLWFRCNLPDTQMGRDIHALVKRGDISECSFAFGCDEGDDDWTDDERGFILRTIRNVTKLFDVSPVAEPAYPGTAVSVA